ncbi:rho GDP-dissociation inhibitor 1-like isoform X1 [Patiria miniata]|uniref:Rho GDP-dissociation inhibitor 3 n=1 Tax=Patiria miniata TaxID=46514 RepID=A0A913Z695_PATMI|nr:rho GDP-dissociation inhibitor 1-like isoform X1 [Patiria miniata]XP_038047330.1 rho GDP-dissociation inhibitor 1-like isoform X1 [Patiria miniata]XP_038047332.1 rho GDP-dissociation inhibitor 1-like isoform X1 [Patiria miniata]XP_038047333.1 rho GDP-dissociation inhibitor 1-like isoform X1 [Patiria miniata]
MKGHACVILLMCLSCVCATALQEKSAKDELLLEYLRQYLTELKRGDEPEAVPAQRGTEELTRDYKPPKEVDLQTLQELDADDETLVKYKEALLGSTADVLDEGGQNVLLKALVFAPVDHEETVLDLTGDLSQFKHRPIVVKEGAEYKIKLIFRVQREIVSGLRYFEAVYRKGIRVDKANFMVGNYGPKTEEHIFQSPVDELPVGMMRRGVYIVKSKFTDDDKNIYLEWEWSFSVKRDWE